MVHAGLVMDGHPTGAGEDTVLVTLMVTLEEELVGKATATSFQDLLGGMVMDMEGARIDFECYWRQIMKDQRLEPGCGMWIELTYHYNILFSFVLFAQE